MPTKRTVLPYRDRDVDGVPVIRIPLAAGGTARTLPATFRSLTEGGWSPFWTLNPNGTRTQSYVRAAHTRASGHLVTVARVITGAGCGEIVTYRDGDRTNLRPENLCVERGKARRCDARAAEGAAGVARRRVRPSQGQITGAAA